MEKDEKINCFGLGTMILSLSSSSIYGIFSSYILHKSENATIISVIIGFIIGIIFSKIFLYIFNNKTNLTFNNKIKLIFPKIAIVINVLFIICSFMGYLFLTHRLTSFLSNEYLLDTPSMYTSIMVILITFYIASKGMETTIRVSIILFFISMFIFVFDFFSLISQVNLENLLPMFTVSIKDIIISSIGYSLYFFVPIIYINTIKKDQIVDSNKFNKYYYLMICLSFVISLISYTTTIGVSGVKINNLFDYPIYTTLKRIKLFSFLDSLENISIMLWLLFIINASSFILLFLFNSMKETFNLSDKVNKIINYLILLLVFLIPNIIFKNQYAESYSYMWIPFSVLTLALFLSIIIAIKLKSRLK